MMPIMRTTVTLDPDTERLLRSAVSARHTSFKRVLNDAIRKGLGAAGSTDKKRKIEIPTFRSNYHRGVDRGRLQQLADEMEADSFTSLRKAKK